jgi:hypothetical protein
MRRLILCIFVGWLGASSACAQKGVDIVKDTAQPSGKDAPKVTREFLLAHGFKESSEYPGDFVLSKVRLKGVARELGFPLSSLEYVVNVTGEIRTVKIRDREFTIESATLDENGFFVPGSLDGPDSLCTVSVSLANIEERQHIKSDSIPRLRIRSVVVPKQDSEPLQVTFDLSAEGKSPVAARQWNFKLFCTIADRSPIWVSLVFPKGTPDPIIVRPGKPMTFTVTTKSAPIPDRTWSSLPTGKYRLHVGIWKWKPGPQSFDYEWMGRGARSDEYKLVVAESAKAGKAKGTGKTPVEAGEE